MSGERQVVAAELEGGRVILIEAEPPRDKETDVSMRQTFAFDQFTDSIEAIANRMTAALEKAKPQRAAVEFGVDVGVETSGLTALLTKGSATATIKVTLEWERPKG